MSRRPALCPALFLLVCTLVSVAGVDEGTTVAAVDALGEPTAASSASSPLPPPSASACASRRLLAPGVRRRAPGPPPDAMPPDLAPFYTRCGAVPTADFFVDDSGEGAGTHYSSTAAGVAALLADARALAALPPAGVARLGARGWLSAALGAAPLRGARVVVFGSSSPLVETLALAHGAAAVTTVEYNNLTYEHAALTTVTPHAALRTRAGRARHARAYDVALSVSSFDHDGLGRYGDPLGPDADLEAVDAVADEWLDPAGPRLLVLSVPVGPDVVAWNLLRRYGRVRLPLLLDAANGEAWGLPPRPADAPPARWEIVRAHGFAPADAAAKLDAPVHFTKSYEPVWTLRAVAGGGAAAAGGGE